jgi:hypothetical protein
MPPESSPKEQTPRSGLQWEDEAARLAENEVDKIKRKWSYSNKGEAFTHLFVRSYFNLDDDDASEACQVGYAGHDKGIDAMYYDEPNGTIHIVGAKYENRSFGPEVVTDIRRAFEFLTGAEPSRVKSELHSAWGFHREGVGRGFSTAYVVAVYGTLNDETRRELANIAVEFESKRWIVEGIQRPEILIHVSAPLSAPKRGPRVAFALFSRNDAHEFVVGRPRLCVALINGGELARAAAQNGLGLFALNLREYLGRANPVNRDIEKSLTEPAQQNLFTYLNLGVDAICDTFSIKDSPQTSLPDNVPIPVLNAVNFRIVNGCQTTMTLLHNPQAAEKCKVMLRLVETKDSSLALSIAVAKNRQTAIKDRELFAHDKIQTIIAKKFERLKRPFFYERRRGEWWSRRKKPRFRALFDERHLGNDKAAKAYLATFLQRPFDAKHRFRFIFRLEAEGGLYETVFKPDLDPKDLLAAFEFFSIAEEQIAKLRKEQRSLAEKKALQEDEKRRIEEISYLVHADTYVGALMWYLCCKYLNRREIEEQFLSFGLPLETRKRSRLDHVFAVASRIIVEHLRVTDMVYRNQGLHFNARNLFALLDFYKELQNAANTLVQESDIKRQK